MTNEEVINEIEKLDDWISKQPSLLEDWCKTSDALYIATQALKAQPSEDCVSREVVIKNIKWWFDKIGLNPDILIDSIITQPSVKPKYTDEEIDKIQEVEQAYVDKMVELAVEEAKRPKGKWMKIPITLCHYPCDGCAKDKSYANDEWCSSCEFWRAEDFDYKCSECGKIYSEVENYCPNCGSYNRGKENAD